MYEGGAPFPGRCGRFSTTRSPRCSPSRMEALVSHAPSSSRPTSLSQVSQPGAASAGGSSPQSSLHLCRVQVNGSRELPRPAEPHPPDLALRCLSGASLGRRSPWPHSVSSPFSVPHSSNPCVLFSVSVYDVGWGQQQTLREKKRIYGSLLVQRRKAGNILQAHVSGGHCEDSKMMSSLLLRTLSITSADEI